MTRALWRPSTTQAKQWSGRAEDERTRDQDGMEKPAAQDESGAGIERQWRSMIYISSKYDGAEESGAEDTGVDRSHVS